MKVKQYDKDNPNLWRYDAANGFEWDVTAESEEEAISQIQAIMDNMKAGYSSLDEGKRQKFKESLLHTGTVKEEDINSETGEIEEVVVP